MAVNFAGYHISMSGMRVNQHGLNVTGHNISNLNTTGYVRQQAMINASHSVTHPTKYGIQQFGLGADIQEVRQIRHMFLDGMYRKENTTLGYWEAKSKTFEDVQAILGEPMENGLQNILNQFWDSWQELSKNPDSLAIRGLVRQRGENLVHHVNHLSGQLDKLQNDLNSEIKVRIDEVNNIFKNIAELNVKILYTEASGDTANDFRDQRNNLLDRLTKLVNCDVQEMQDGQLDILVGGYFLVNKGTYMPLVAEERQKGSQFYVPKIAGTDIEIPLSDGTIKGLLESRGEVSGAIGSLENGTPNTKADIVFAVDISENSNTNLDDINASINAYITELDKRGIDYNLRLISYAGNIGVTKSYGSDSTAFINDVNLLEIEVGDQTNDFGNVVNELEDLSGFRADANRYAIVFTGESIDGDEVVVTDSEVEGYIDTLINKGIKVSVVTDVEKDWDSITDATGGSLYNMASTDFEKMFASIVTDINTDVSNSMSRIETTNNILSDLKAKLNALVNILVREINYIHQNGKTLDKPPLDGQDFFTVINPNLPLQMGNIRLNANLMDLNKIVASSGVEAGDNSIARQIANLRHKPVMRDVTGITDLDNYYQSIILSVGNGGSDATRIAENQRSLVQSADAYRQSIMAVSMDEEMTNMMKFKFAYNASSRSLSVIDEMMETVITRMGLAGR